MTVDAERSLLCANHLIVWFEDRVVAVTGDALAQLSLIEGSLVRTRLKQLSLPRVTLPAHVGNRSNAGRRRAVIAMTVVAGRRGQILLFVNGFGVHTGLVFLVLVARNSKRAHVIRARVTLRAGLGNVRRI